MPSSWVGQKVVLKYRPPVKVTGRVMDQVDYHVFTVTQVKGDQLRLNAGSIECSVRSSQVLLLDQAIPFYTREIKVKPSNSSAWALRGIVWHEKKDYDKALVDFDKVIQLNPKWSWAYQLRGNARSSKHEYDKAIADFAEAIKLDPKSAWTYRSRGMPGAARRSTTKAIADYDEAIKLAPKDAAPYAGRGLSWYQQE